MMSDPTPVPLDEIKQRRTSYSTRGGVTIAGFTPEERDALCEALRIAVEGLATVQNGQRCEKVVATAPESSTCIHQSNLTRDARYLADRWCDPCIARHALAAVRELVDLGEKP